jgi:hypothetical protein
MLRWDRLADGGGRDPEARLTDASWVLAGRVARVRSPPRQLRCRITFLANSMSTPPGPFVFG